MVNLEPLAASAAAKMVGADPGAAENLITKALMVLSEQGLFAFGLFLATRRRPQDVRAADDIHRAASGLLAEAGLVDAEGPGAGMADYYRRITHARAGESQVAALQRILLTKQALETALTYGRYHAKAGLARD
jgi:hypothetical protein